MFNILTLNKIAECGMQQLPDEHFHSSAEQENPDGIILRSFQMDEKHLTPNLLAIARAGAGVNNIPVDTCAQKGIVVFNTPGANANAVKELVIFGLIAASRKVVQGINWTQGLAGTTGVAEAVEKGKADFAGPEIMGKTLGVVGMGAIGILVANAAAQLGMNVAGFDPWLTEQNAAKLDPKVKMEPALDALLAASDYVTLHQPLTPDTKKMFGAELFAKCKNGMRLLNFARGELVCAESVKKALESGKLSCYVIDFPDETVLGIDGIITIPHLGASTPESEDNCAFMAASQLREFILTGNVVNSVNYPDCRLDSAGGARVCVLSKKADMAEITKAVSGIGKILGTASKENKEYAYAIFDVDAQGAGDLGAIEKIANVTRVRAIGK